MIERTIMAHAPLETLKDHWAITAVGHDSIERADRLCFKRSNDQATSNQIDFSFTASPEDVPLLERVALAYELIAIEGLDALSHPSSKNQHLKDQTRAAASRALDFQWGLPLPSEISDRLYFVLQLSAMAVCGDRWSDLLRWYKEHVDLPIPPSDREVRWDHRMFYKLFDCWVSIFRKDSWQDLNHILQIIAELRNEQKTFESDLFHSDSESKKQTIALRLAALYHWAKCTETLATYMVQGEPSDPLGNLDKHFKSSIDAARASGDIQLEMILRWLYATSHILVKDSPWRSS